MSSEQEAGEPGEPQADAPTPDRVEGWNAELEGPPTQVLPAVVGPFDAPVVMPDPVAAPGPAGEPETVVAPNSAADPYEIVAAPPAEKSPVEEPPVEVDDDVTEVALPRVTEDAAVTATIDEEVVEAAASPTGEPAAESPAAVIHEPVTVVPETRPAPVAAVLSAPVTPPSREVDDEATAMSDLLADERPPASGRGARRALRTAWIVLLVVVLAAGAWAAWLLVGTNQLARNTANHLIDDYFASCDSGGDAQVVGVLSLPDLDGESWPIVTGSDDDALSAGVAWYPSTAEPGEVGNTVVAGYRLAHGEPFRHLLDLDAGDRVQIETCDQVLTYVIEVAPRDLTVGDHDDWVMDAVPGDPGRLPTASMVTLVTSQDLLPTSDRSVGFARLDEAQPRS
nr:class E sortase [Brooklawnia cerclae]